MVWLLFFLFLTSCRTEYVPLETVRYDSLFISKLVRDSMYVRDSVYIHEKGDSVLKFEYKYVYLYKNKVDTFYVYKDREIEIPVPIERKLSFWERIKIDYGGWACLLVLVALIWKLQTWFARRIRKE